MFVAISRFFKYLRRIRDNIEMQDFLRVGENVSEMQFYKHFKEKRLLKES